jgi:glycosyltransferase involved in cell wall biosynthesis
VTRSIRSEADPEKDAVDPRHLAGVRVAFLSWRDTGNPEGGGAERYLEEVAMGLVARGAEVTVFSAAYPGAPPEEVRDGIRFVRRGSKLSVYPRGMQALRSGRLGRPDVVVDVQNGLPFFTRLVTRKPVIVLVHHVHREQWPIVYPGLTGRVGWWLESRVAPRLYRRCQYVAVSDATREELRRLGVPAEHIAIVHNGSEEPSGTRAAKSAHPSICVVSRLVPHKQIEHAIDAALQLRAELPDLTLTVVGDGWWEANLHRYAAQRGAGDTVRFTGHVSEQEKRRVYDESWVMALPSLKEGWGLVVGEAALSRTPTVAYRSAGGTRESVVHGTSGLLADDPDDLVAALQQVLTDPALREHLAHGAQENSRRFSWARAHAAFGHVVATVLDGRRMAAQDEVDPRELPDAGRGEAPLSRRSR